VHRDLNTQQEGKILVQKRNNRWLCLPSKASIQIRQEKQIKTNSNKVTPSYPKKEQCQRNYHQDSKQNSQRDTKSVTPQESRKKKNNQSAHHRQLVSAALIFCMSCIIYI
jgi:hypothetical protein